MPSSFFTWKKVIVVLLSTTLAVQVQQKEFVHKTFVRGRKDIDKDGDKNVGKAFLLKLDGGCTGTLIAKDWVRFFPQIL